MYRIRQKQKNKHPNHDRWLVSYADYMTLMFALFVVLYASAIIKEQSFDVLSESLGKIFDISGDAGTGVSGTGNLTNQVSEVESFDGNFILKEKDLEKTKQKLVVNQLDKNKLGDPLDVLNNELKSALYELTENGLAKLEQKDDWLTIELSSGLLFPSGSATTSPAAAIIIKELAYILHGVNNLIEIRGYTDSLTINNELFSSNWELSAARAASITNMMEKYGLAKHRLSIKANGSNNPIASNDNSEGRAKNRRVVIALSKFAYQPVHNDELNSDKKVLQKKLSDSIEQKVTDYNKIQVIKMPNGGIKITTRKEPDDVNKTNN